MSFFQPHAQHPVQDQRYETYQRAGDGLSKSAARNAPRWIKMLLKHGYIADTPAA